MAEQVKVPDLNSGVPATDPTNGIFYVAINGQDYPIEYESLFRYIYRANSNETCNGTSNQTITYSEPFLNVKPQIFDFMGLGIEIVSWSTAGFVINSYGTGEFGYLTIKER
jgi:hypothetical protein